MSQHRTHFQQTRSECRQNTLSMLSPTPASTNTAHATLIMVKFLHFKLIGEHFKCVKDYNFQLRLPINIMMELIT